MSKNGVNKFVWMVLISIYSSLVFSSNCPQAVAADDENFCSSFQSVAQCHCQASGLPASMCNNVSLVYRRMIITFGNIERACMFQKETSTATCLEYWRCFQEGGMTDSGLLCNGNGSACTLG